MPGLHTYDPDTTHHRKVNYLFKGLSSLNCLITFGDCSAHLAQQLRNHVTNRQTLESCVYLEVFEFRKFTNSSPALNSDCTSLRLFIVIRKCCHINNSGLSSQSDTFRFPWRYLFYGSVLCCCLAAKIRELNRSVSFRRAD